MAPKARLRKICSGWAFDLMHHVHDVIELKSILPVGRNVFNESKNMINSVSVKVPSFKKMKNSRSDTPDKARENEKTINNGEGNVEENEDDMNFLVLRGALIYLNQSNLLVMLPSTM
uniref:Uncharacterized protein n=1 Tax=Romanomermis culicivorax TaxID=13658 RepID=A0A915J4A2_ROMCU